MIRLEKGDTLEEFGKKLDTSKVTVFNWEKGRNLPNKANLKRIAEIGKKTVEELLFGNHENFIYEVLISSFESELLKVFTDYLRIVNRDFINFENGITYDSDSNIAHTLEQHFAAVSEVAFYLFKDFVKDNLNEIIKRIQFENTGPINSSNKEGIISSCESYINLLILNEMFTFEGIANAFINTIQTKLPIIYIGDTSLDEYIELRLKAGSTPPNHKNQIYMYDGLSDKEIEMFKEKDEEKLKNWKFDKEEIIKNAINSYYEDKLKNVMTRAWDDTKELIEQFEEDLSKHLPK